jgi:hypothetical protein
MRKVQVRADIEPDVANWPVASSKTKKLKRTTTVRINVAGAFILPGRWVQPTLANFPVEQREIGSFAEDPASAGRLLIGTKADLSAPKPLEHRQPGLLYWLAMRSGLLDRRIGICLTLQLGIDFSTHEDDHRGNPDPGHEAHGPSK